MEGRQPPLQPHPKKITSQLKDKDNPPVISNYLSKKEIVEEWLLAYKKMPDVKIWASFPTSLDERLNVIFSWFVT